MGLLSSVASVVGDLGGTALQASYNRKSEKRQRAFIREQMKNRHQWEAGDLESAGLNRILSLGGQPPVTSGSTSSISAPKLGSDAVTAYNKSKLTKGQMASLAATTAKGIAEEKVAHENAKHIRAQTELTQHTAESVKAQNAARKIEEALFEKYPWLRAIKIASDNLGPAVGAAAGAGGAVYLGRKAKNKRGNANTEPPPKIKWKKKRNSDTHDRHGRKRNTWKLPQ